MSEEPVTSTEPARPVELPEPVSPVMPTAPIKEGSSLYYSLLWTPADAKDRFQHRLALISALATTLDDVYEPQVAEKKIHWWHEELQRLHDGNARHPALQANQKHLKANAQAQAACLEIVSVAASQRFSTAETIDTADADLVRSFRARLALLSHALSGGDSSGSDEALDLATHPDSAALALALHEQLTRLPNLIHRGLPVFSDELYKQFDVRPNDLAEHIRVASAGQSDSESKSSAPGDSAPTLKSIPIVSEKPGRAKLISHAIERSHSTISGALNDDEVIRRYRQPALIPLWRLLVLRKHQLALWQKREPDLLRERLTLTPLVKLFRAWQNKK